MHALTVAGVEERDRAALSPRVRRLGALVVCGAIAALLGVAGSLQPDGEGLGTHEALGMPPCSLYAYTGTPCPTCGYTTAFSHVMHGQLLAAFEVQPAGALLALLTAAAGALALCVLITGRPVYRHLARWRRPATLWVALAVVLGGWLYKIGAVSGH
ncbi:MAG: DUF2752 domain-containing protein [Alphaproteobacteria bacterium]|jgi:hypothetical protein|nr:DUF2752 domain-containing protein [Alphaproteobacteria bacterium]